ncbi:chloride channel protein [Angustibacter sp. McL0619]|uniref:chloride channel protein n=1 Tax=Angustibacter sp. McL0619 TaxID=3415676 RepID=UPI003CF08233
MTVQSPPADMTGTAYLRLILYAALIGIPAALVAAGFLALVHVVEGWLWTDLPDALGADSPPWYLVLVLPVVGAVVVLLARRLLPGDGGHEPLLGINASPTPVSFAPGVALAALGTLAFGAVLGPEAPLIALGSVVGMVVVKFVKVGKAGTAVLSTAGSFSAVSALFGGPLVAGILLIEASIGLGAAAIPVLLPGLVAAGVGYLIFIGLGSWGGLNATVLEVPDLPPYTGVHLGDLVVSLGVGIVAGVVVVVIRRIARVVAAMDRPRRAGGLPMGLLLVAGGAAVGLLALVADWLGADSQDVLFSGQSSLPVLVDQPTAKIVLILLVAKGLGYAVCLGCGFRGGPVFPAIFLGVALASLAEVIFNISPTLTIAVGAAAGMAAMTRLLFASLLFALLLDGLGGLDAIPVAVLACAGAWVVVHALEPDKPAPAPAPTPT